MTLYVYVGRREVKGGLKHCVVSAADPETLTFWPKASSSAFKSAVIGRTYDVGERLPSYWPSVMTDAPADPRALDWQVKDKLEYEATLKLEHAPELASIVADLRAARARMSPLRS